MPPTYYQPMQFESLLVIGCINSTSPIFSMDMPIFFTCDPNDYDDLGVRRGNTYFDDTPTVRPLVENWRITSVGNRPTDHLARDLLFASCQRDPRLWRLRKMFANKPLWMCRDVFTLCVHEQAMAVKYRALHFEHLRHLNSIAPSATEYERRLIDRLCNCWPYTVEVEWAGPGDKSPRDVCKMARQCPFCFARLVVDLYHRLRQGPCPDRTHKLFVLGRLSLSDELFDRDQRHVDPRDRCKFVRKQIGNYLVSFAKSIGVEGGLISFQVGPQLYENRVWREGSAEFESQEGFRYELAVLGEVTACIGRFVKAFDEDDEKVRLPPGSGLEVMAVGGQLLLPEWSCASGWRKNSLRTLLVGTSPAYRNNCVVGGHRGAFALQPWSLANYCQWHEHLESTKNLKVFDTWGCWRSSVPPCRLRAGQDSRLINAPARRPQYRQRLALCATNESRRTEAHARREQLLEMVLSTHSDLAIPDGEQLGRTQLQEALAARGCNASERDVRWLVDQLGRPASATP